MVPILVLCENQVFIMLINAVCYVVLISWSESYKQCSTQYQNKTEVLPAFIQDIDMQVKIVAKKEVSSK